MTCPIYGFKHVYNHGELNLFTSLRHGKMLLFAPKSTFWSQTVSGSLKLGVEEGGGGESETSPLGFHSVKAQ